MDNIFDKLESVSHLNAIECVVDIKDDNVKGKLSGTNVVIKDNISTKGINTTASSKILEDYKPVFNATVVDKIVSEGARIVAKTTMDEFGMGGFGKTSKNGVVLNPLDNTRVSGGSSAGSAALVGAGVVDVSIGTDTGDSMRIPASYCGIVGLKPTYGRISRFGVIPYANSLDHVGIFSKDIKTLALMLEVVSGFDKNDLTSSHKEVSEYSKLNLDVKDSKVLVIDNVVEAIKNKDILEVFNNLILKLQNVGVNISNIKFDENLFKAQNAIYQIISNAEAFSNHSALDGVAYGRRADGKTLDEVMLNSRTEGFGFQVRMRHLFGAYSLSSENKEKLYDKALKVRRLLVDEINKNLIDNDFYIAPASGRIAPRVDEDLSLDPLSDENLIANNFMVMDNYSGNPSIVVPMGKVSGMPIGIYISSSAFNEELLLNFAALIEELVGEL